MELRSKKAIGWLIVLAFAAPAAAADYTAVRHHHWRKGCDGVLAVTASGVAFHGASQHTWAWSWDDIQQLTAGDRVVHVLTYRDRLSRLGADQNEEFTLAPGQNLTPDFALLRRQLGPKFVAAAVTGDAPAGAIPVKLLGLLSGTHGFLAIGESEVAFRTDAPGRSRSWALSDIRAISHTGPYDLTVTTYERGGEFRFQLKRPLPAPAYDALWLRLNRSQGLRILTSYQEETK